MGLCNDRCLGFDFHELRYCFSESWRDSKQLLKKYYHKILKIQDFRKFQSQKIPGNFRLFGVFFHWKISRFFWKINFSKDFQRKSIFFEIFPKSEKIKNFGRDFFKSHGVPALLSIMKRNVTILVSNSKKIRTCWTLISKNVFQIEKKKEKCYLVTILLFKTCLVP